MKSLFGPNSQESLGLFSAFGYILFFFYIGVKTDMSVVLRTRKSATSIGTAAVMAPFLCGITIIHFHSAKYLDHEHVRMLGFMTGMLCLTPYPVVSSVLNDLKILNSELGRLGLSSALVSEMFSIFFNVTAALTRTMSKYGVKEALICLAVAVLFVFLVIFAIRPILFWIIKQTPEGSLVNDHCVYCIIIVALLTAYASHVFQFYSILGPYILGLAIPEGPPLGTAIIKKIDTFVNGVFMPIFVTTCAIRVDLTDLFNWRTKNGSIDNFMVQTLVIILVTVSAKFVVCMIHPLWNKMPLNYALSLSLIMSCKGIVEMAAYSLIKDMMEIPDNVFALLMVCMMIISTIMPMLLSLLYDPLKKYAGYTRRNIMDLGRNTELRVLTCIHGDENILSTIKLLEATYPTKEDPICAFVLHLIELIGRASPIFISHQLQKKKNKNDSNSYRSENLLDAFNNFEKEVNDGLTVNTFTAVSPQEMMYDDICTLALDKLTSLIILPFHRKWSSDGNLIELEDESLRELNYRIMERAPCSVGILIEKAQMTHIFSEETPYTVCLLFIGGKDDREALFVAKRMMKNPHVRLTVLRIFAESNRNGDVKDWEGMLDRELLNEIIMIKHKVGEVKYIEKSVKDGPETVLKIRSLVSEYDLVIVGRQAGVESAETCGLLQWSEYPELGVLGDLLASTDAAGKASVFVIQQQRTATDI
ncbi:PREDICTED: cation/H(+) antiporter 4-like [Lupinus angustifolius]|nr:PREDICTED: cation/H(+) antiporter 4-like [Lupinus angustifolius]